MKAAKELGVLAETITVAMQIWDRQKAEGVSLEDRQEGLEKTLRVAWPFTRTWKFLCEECSDTGWAPGICESRTPCGRKVCTAGHTYVRACYCEKGEKMARLLEKKSRKSDEDFTAAGVRKPTRIGR